MKNLLQTFSTSNYFLPGLRHEGSASGKIHKIIVISYVVLTTILLSRCSSAEVTYPTAVGPVPTENQLAWHRMEMNAFIHFTTNTFTDLEWGYGDEKPEIFNPTDFNPEQWVEILKKAGFKGVVLTCKHHDGFCLWPSQLTAHSVKNSSWRNGKGNVVKDVHDACKKYGLKFGIYISPWDRNHAEYGKPAYVEYYRNQLKELFAFCSPVFEIWFDGANGGTGYYGGAREKRQINNKTYYEWDKTIEMIRKAEPNAILFSDAGPDIRWCGNEKGFVGETNWNAVRADTLHPGMPIDRRILNSGSEDGNHWIPAEVDVSIRQGWFYHASQDSLVKTPERLFEIYLTSVGRGANLLLNVPPNRMGIIHENDVKALTEWRKLLDETFSNDFALHKKVRAASCRGRSKLFSPSNITDADPETYWATDDGVTSGYLEIDLKAKKMVSYILIQEYIRLGQRVKNFTVDAWTGKQWKQVGAATTIGYKRIVKIEPVETEKVRVYINDSKACPLISNVEIY